MIWGLPTILRLTHWYWAGIRKHMTPLDHKPWAESASGTRYCISDIHDTSPSAQNRPYIFCHTVDPGLEAIRPVYECDKDQTVCGRHALVLLSRYCSWSGRWMLLLFTVFNWYYRLHKRFVIYCLLTVITDYIKDLCPIGKIWYIPVTYQTKGSLVKQRFQVYCFCYTTRLSW